MNILDTLSEANPGQSLVDLAVSTLRNPVEIKQFYCEYVELLRNSRSGFVGEHERANPEVATKRRIEYLLLYYPKEYATPWVESLPGIIEYKGTGNK